MGKKGRETLATLVLVASMVGCATVPWEIYTRQQKALAVCMDEHDRSEKLCERQGVSLNYAAAGVIMGEVVAVLATIGVVRKVFPSNNDGESGK